MAKSKIEKLAEEFEALKASSRNAQAEERAILAKASDERKVEQLETDIRRATNRNNAAEAQLERTRVAVGASAPAPTPEPVVASTSTAVPENEGPSKPTKKSSTKAAAPTEE